MKVFKNSIQGGWCGGCLLVAANSAEEAHCIAAQSEEVSYMYNQYDGDFNVIENPSDWKSDDFPKDNWKEVEGLSYDGTESKVIISDFYRE